MSLASVRRSPCSLLLQAVAYLTTSTHATLDNTVLDVPAHASSWLINDVFRSEFGFGEGLTISDCNDVNVLQNFSIANNESQAAAKGLLAGVDMDLQCGTTSTYTVPNVGDALESGNLADSDALDAAVRHVLTAKFAAGLFENPCVSMKSSVQYCTVCSFGQSLSHTTSTHAGTPIPRSKTRPLTPTPPTVRSLGRRRGRELCCSRTTRPRRFR